MGCYGHFFIERKRGRDNWECVFQWYGPQLYTFFSVLANVRNDETHPIFPIAKPKGLPLDISWRVKSAHEEGDDQADTHNASWLTLDEILSYPYWESQIPGSEREEKIRDDCQPLFRDIVRLLEILEEREGRRSPKIRFVFWFDG